MPDPSIPFDVDQYSVPERLAIIGAIWDTVGDDEEIPLTPAQSAELERRYAASLGPLDGLVPWAEVKRRVAGGL
jgi:putative addiction module component (TIGR02574 family)